MSNRLSQREALKQFASLARHMKPQKCRTFANYVVPLLQNMFSVADPTIMVRNCGVIAFNKMKLTFRFLSSSNVSHVGSHGGLHGQNIENPGVLYHGG